MKLTIFTPTFNRAYILPKLYESLVNQTNKEFVWLIVDDGSTDNTKEIVDFWLKENKIDMKYIYQNNQGKMQAHNTGVENTKTQLFVCVDSDDYLVETAVADIFACYQSWEQNSEVAGAVLYRGKNASTPLGTTFPKKSIPYSSLNDLYRNGFKGDTTLVFRTEILKEFKFPKIDGEKFITEDYVYSQIDERYIMYIEPKIIIICGYLSDGYTKNIYKVFNTNPKGMALYYNQKVKLSKSFLEACKYMSGYICYSKIAHNKHAYANANSKFKYLLTYPLGILLFLKRKRYK